MRLANDYLEQARHLATRERTRPKQASLRRAVSVAYYALFHLLSDEASKTLVRGLRDSNDLQARTARTLDHGAMAHACRAFSAGALPSALSFLLPLDADLRLVAQRFAIAQESRHRVDYNLQINFNRTDTPKLHRSSRRSLQRLESRKPNRRRDLFSVRAVLLRKRPFPRVNRKCS